jgi:hypothetical protein
MQDDRSERDDGIYYVTVRYPVKKIVINILEPKEVPKDSFLPSKEAVSNALDSVMKLFKKGG